MMSGLCEEITSAFEFIQGPWLWVFSQSLMDLAAKYPNESVTCLLHVFYYFSGYGKESPGTKYIFNASWN